MWVEQISFTTIFSRKFKRLLWSLIAKKVQITFMGGNSLKGNNIKSQKSFVRFVCFLIVTHYETLLKHWINQCTFILRLRHIFIAKFYRNILVQCRHSLLTIDLRLPLYKGKEKSSQPRTLQYYPISFSMRSFKKPSRMHHVASLSYTSRFLTNTFRNRMPTPLHLYSQKWNRPTWEFILRAALNESSVSDWYYNISQLIIHDLTKLKWQLVEVTSLAHLQSKRSLWEIIIIQLS